MTSATMSQPAAELDAGDPHCTREWFDLLAATALPPGTAVKFAPVGPTGQDDAALLPLMRLPESRHRVDALANFYTPLYAPIGLDQLDPASLAATFAKLRYDGTAVLRLAPLAAGGAFHATALAALRQAGWIADTYFCFGNWYAPIVTADFEAYLAERPSALRNTFRRARNRLERRPDFRLRIQQAPDAQLEAAIAGFERVYAASWKRPEPWPDFIPGLCRLAARCGWLRLGVIELDGQPAAAQIWLVAAGKAHIVKLAYDPAWRDLSVGTVLTAALMRHVIESDGVAEIDYLIGDDAYKRDWTPLRRERVGLVAFNPASARGLAAAAHHFGGKVVRRVRSNGDN